MISIIAAMDKNGLIGSDNKLPWNIPEDLRYFKEKTMGKYVIMGERTFSSIKSPLSGRDIIVLSRERKVLPNAKVANSIERALSLAEGDEIMIAGGASVYEQFLEIADRMYLTVINKEFKGNVYFPEFDGKKWELKEERRGQDPLVFYKIFERKIN